MSQFIAHPVSALSRGDSFTSHSPGCRTNDMDVQYQTTCAFEFRTKAAVKLREVTGLWSRSTETERESAVHRKKPCEQGSKILRRSQARSFIKTYLTPPPKSLLTPKRQGGSILPGGQSFTASSCPTARWRILRRSVFGTFITSGRHQAPGICQSSTPLASRNQPGKCVLAPGVHMLTATAL